jgi:hypothetical protein
MVEQKQKMKIDPSKPWPFPVILGVDNRGLSDLDDKFKQNQSRCSVKWTKQRKCPLYEAVADMEEALF